MRAGGCVCLCVWRVCVYACVRVCVRVCMCVRRCMGVCVGKAFDNGGSRESSKRLTRVVGTIIYSYCVPAHQQAAQR